MNIEDFKVGQKVRITKKTYGSDPVGLEGTVKSVNYRVNHVLVEGLPEDGEWFFNMKGSDGEIEVIGEPGPYVVCTVDEFGGFGYDADLHATYTLAEADAKSRFDDLESDDYVGIFKLVAKSERAEIKIAKVN